MEPKGIMLSEKHISNGNLQHDYIFYKILRNGRIIVMENWAVSAKSWHWGEGVTIKEQEGAFWSDQLCVLIIIVVSQINMYDKIPQDCTPPRNAKNMSACKNLENSSKVWV